NIEARVHVFGSAENPEFELTSTPPLPQEEIVSRILFERGTAQLSAAEAFQLSTTIASLSGEGGPGIIDRARQGLGLDVLSFGAGEEGSLGEVEAGKYIADGVFVGVRQGATPQSTSAVVEVEVTPNITVESENKSTGDTSIGVRWQWDY
ncbi:MAG: translocation/assembly module TamB domain-containing protein, partial [Rhodovibrionaceae bacterium]